MRFPYAAAFASKGSDQFVEGRVHRAALALRGELVAGVTCLIDNLAQHFKLLLQILDGLTVHDASRLLESLTVSGLAGGCVSMEAWLGHGVPFGVVWASL